jgi:NADH:ubiquinone oxidoreductase subunit 6 (subunit J)
MFFSAIFFFDIKEVKRGRRKNWPLRFLFNFHAVFYQVFILVSYWWAIILLFFYYFFLGGGGRFYFEKRSKGLYVFLWIVICTFGSMSTYFLYLLRKNAHPSLISHNWTSDPM